MQVPCPSEPVSREAALRSAGGADSRGGNLPGAADPAGDSWRYLFELLAARGEILPGDSAGMG